MGPVNSRIVPGRGDKNQAAEQLIDTIIQNDFDMLKYKYKQLDNDEKEELTNIFLGENMDELFEDSYELKSFFVQTFDGEKKDILTQIFAFMEAHPSQVTKE